MTNLIEKFTSKAADKRVRNKTDSQTKAAAKKKTQAKKKQAEQPLEFIWLQNFLHLLVTHKVKAGLLAVLVMIFSLPMVMAKTQWLPIEKIILSGQFVQLKTDVLEKKLKPYLGKGFFSVDIKEIQASLVLQPWIAKVSVRRVWPDQINVSVEEKRAVARWDDMNLLSDRAVIFKQESSMFNHLPKVNGYREQSGELLTRYGKLQKQFSALGLQVNELNEDGKGATNLLINEQIRINLGSENNEQKIKHLLAVYKKQIQPESEHIRYIDFRYSNGFAIAWKENYLQQRAKTKKRGNRNV